jgi:hypothetical protein
MVLTYFVFKICVECKCPEDLLQQAPPQFQIIAAAKTGQCLAKKKELNLMRREGMKIGNEKVSI